jgi:hypothetical protein
MTDAPQRQARTSTAIGRSPPSSVLSHDSRRGAVLVDAARRYLRRGFSVLPIPPGQKGPAGLARRNWQHVRLREHELTRAFRFAGNIGLILGRLSRHLVDVDLDCEEARALADRFLPATPAVTGRASSPRSHRWYISPGIITRRHQDPVTHASMLELRSTGSQTLVGPSIHPSGEPYDPLDAEPAVVAPSALVEAVNQIADEIVRQRHGANALTSLGRPAVAQRPTVATVERSQILKRASAYLGRMPPAISGQGGHGRTYAAATVLVHGFCLSESEALDLLRTQFNPRCDPPWTNKELEHKVADAATKPHSRPRGWLLGQA